MEKYKVGDHVWVARAEHREVKCACPVCCGKMQVRLTLGNDDVVTLPCDYCGKGYNAPTGYVNERVFFSGAEAMTIDRVDVSHSDSGEDVEYRSGHYILYPVDTFATRDEALIRGVEKAAKVNHDENTRLECIKANVQKTFSWNAGYHLREAKRNESEAVRHREKAALCKARAKEEV